MISREVGDQGGAVSGRRGGPATAHCGAGALPNAAAVVDLAAADAAVAAGRAAGFADVTRTDSRALLQALGGGPPTPLREAGAQAETAAVALDRAAAALGDAASALRSFAAQLR